MSNINHITALSGIIELAAQKSYVELRESIEGHYFKAPVFEEGSYSKADNFVYRMDVTGMGYGEALALARESLDKEEMDQYLIALKIVLVKLKGNQRYTYYDCSVLRQLIDPEAVASARPITDTGLLQDIDLYPTGFIGMKMEDYGGGSLRTAYDRHRPINEAALAKEYTSAVDQGNIYHHIIETDHMINREPSQVTSFQWLHLIRLLTAHYATEKPAWQPELTQDLLQAYKGLAASLTAQDFKALVYDPVSVTLKIAVKKMRQSERDQLSLQTEQILNFLVCVYTMTSDARYIDYIRDIASLLQEGDGSQALKQLKLWLLEKA